MMAMRSFVKAVTNQGVTSQKRARPYTVKGSLPEGGVGVAVGQDAQVGPEKIERLFMSLRHNHATMHDRSFLTPRILFSFPVVDRANLFSGRCTNLWKFDWRLESYSSTDGFYQIYF